MGNAISEYGTVRRVGILLNANLFLHSTSVTRKEGIMDRNRMKFMSVVNETISGI